MALFFCSQDVCSDSSDGHQRESDRGCPRGQQAGRFDLGMVNGRTSGRVRQTLHGFRGFCSAAVGLIAAG